MQFYEKSEVKEFTIIESLIEKMELLNLSQKEEDILNESFKLYITHKNLVDCLEG